MTLREDLNASLRHMDSNSGITATEIDDENSGQLIVSVPPSLIDLHDNQLIIDVRLASSERAFTLSSPVLAFEDQMPDVEFLDALLRRQFDDSLMGRVSVAIADAGEIDVLVGMTHWTVDRINTEQFSQLYKAYLIGTFDLIDEVNQMAKGAKHVLSLHKGRG